MQRREFLRASGALTACMATGIACRKTGGTSSASDASTIFQAIDIDAVPYGESRTDTGTVPLMVSAIVPNGKGPFPVCVVFGGGGFEFLDWPNEVQMYRYLAERGIVLLHPWYRTVGQHPITMGDSTCETRKRQGFRAAFSDQRVFMKWLLSPGNSFVDFCGGDISRLFLAGWSAGGVSSMYNANAFSRNVRAAIGFSCGFGQDNVSQVFDSSDDHTRDTREWMTEKELGVWTPPLALFQTADDAIIGGHWNLALADAAANVPESWTFIKPHGDPRIYFHDGPQYFGDVVLDGETMPCLEAVRRFIEINQYT